MPCWLAFDNAGFHFIRFSFTGRFRAAPSRCVTFRFFAAPSLPPYAVRCGEDGDIRLRHFAAAFSVIFHAITVDIVSCHCFLLPPAVSYRHLSSTTPDAFFRRQYMPFRFFFAPPYVFAVNISLPYAAFRLMPYCFATLMLRSITLLRACLCHAAGTPSHVFADDDYMLIY